jgi:hypothetical protein
MRRCARTFLLLASGGVRVSWACGSHKDFASETAVDVAVLADHLPTFHHHHAHLPHHHHPIYRGVLA